MKILAETVVEVDLAKCRRRVKKCGQRKGGYTKTQVKKLLKLYDMFERGEFDECIKFVKTWGRDKRCECKEAEFIDIPVFDFLWDYHSGTYNRCRLLPQRCIICKRFDCIC